MLLGAVLFIFAASGLVLLSVYRHSSLTLSHGIVVTLPVLGLQFALQLVTSISASGMSMPLIIDSVVSAAWLMGGGALVLATTRYDVLSMRSGTGTAGERAAVREMNEAIVTVERNGMLARANSAAVDLFGTSLDNEPFVDIVGHELPHLAECEVIECWTAGGRKQFDPRVTELVNNHDEVFGYTVTLIDITNREIRRQRIEVLNRILRHNIRNSLDIINAHAELVSDENRSAPILDTTSKLDRLSTDARRIESLLERPQDERSTSELATVVTSVTADLTEDHPDASVSTNLSDLSVSVETELCRFTIREIVENAIVHNEGTEHRVEIRGTEIEAGVRLVVADDGPGIPEHEKMVIERRSESQHSHASSLGLWGTNWAVQELGGELSLRDSDLGGTAAVIELPAT
jgi:signal transduction histidine kinase